MKARVAVAVVLGAVLISSIVILRTPTSPFKTETQSQELATTPATAAPLSHDRGSFSPNTSTPQPVSPPAHAEELPGTPPNKLERLGEIRESFRALAAGAAQSALQAAKQLTNEVERETALL